MEVESKEYASKGVAGTGLGLGIAGTAIGLLNGGGLAALGLGGRGASAQNAGTADNDAVNRYEAALMQRIATLETEVKLRDANTYTLDKMNDLRTYVDNRLAAIETRQNEAAVLSATQTATIGCMAQRIAQLQTLTKLVVPNSSVCPGWGNVTITPTTATTTAAA